jgi:hypothetical protein
MYLMLKLMIDKQKKKKKFFGILYIYNKLTEEILISIS